MTTSIDSFFAAWGMADATARLAAIRTVTRDTTSYADPRTAHAVIGPEAIADYIGMFTNAAPGATVSVVKSDVQQDITRATIAFRMAEGMVQHGQYFIEADGDTLTRLVGFVGTGAPE